MASPRGMVGPFTLAGGLATLGWMVWTAYGCVGNAWYGCWADGTAHRGLAAGFVGVFLYACGLILTFSWDPPDARLGAGP